MNRRQQVHVSRLVKFRALNYHSETFYNTTSVGLPNVKCQNCGFSKETLCSKGIVKLDAFQQPPSGNMVILICYNQSWPEIRDNLLPGRQNFPVNILQ